MSSLVTSPFPFFTLLKPGLPGFLTLFLQQLGFSSFCSTDSALLNDNNGFSPVSHPVNCSPLLGRFSSLRFWNNAFSMFSVSLAASSKLSFLARTRGRDFCWLSAGICPLPPLPSLLYLCSLFGWALNPIAFNALYILKISISS